MKGRVLVLGAEGGAGRAALVVNGRLEDLLADPGEPGAAPTPGEIRLGRVDRLVPGAGAAFLRLGGGHAGYLRDAKGVAEGERLAVQVVSLPEAGKASPVTRRLLLKGRLAIFTPGAPGINVSRQIREADERERLAAAVAAAAEGAEAGEAAGWVVRTAAREAPEEALAREVAALLAEYRALSRAEPGDGPLVPAGALRTALREWTDPPPDRIVCTPAAWERLAGSDEPALHPSGPLRRRCETEGGDPFDHFGVWDEIRRLAPAEAALPSGGSMAIEPTRALVAVDVNTGGGFGAGPAMTANLEAARELPRQLRLRGLGGQVVVDFAPVPKKERRRVEDALKTSFRRDPVETSLAGWSALGLFELARKRERRPLSAGSFTPD